ncbi:MAG: hypothetical protein U0N27_04720 [Massilistercora timonensis]
MLDHMEKKQYKKAMEIADTIDWRRVKSTSMLNTVSEIYELCGEIQKSRDILFMAFDRAPGSRKIIYRLGLLALKLNDVEEASDCYEEFVKAAPKDPNQHILKYKILKAQKAPLTEQIAALEDFKKAEYVEKWAYELANLYHEAGMTAKCLEECDDLILWFSEGKYVYQAMELKMKYKPLTPLQQEKYDSRPGAPKVRKPGYAAAAASASAAAALHRGETRTYVKAEVEEAPAAEEAEELPKEVAETAAEEAVTEAAAEVVEPEEEAAAAEVAEEVVEPEEVAEAEEKEEEPAHTPISRVVKGATLEEALANGVAMANSLNIEEKAMAERDEELRIGGQMKIDEILQAWEEKQKVHAQAIEEQKQKDDERLEKEREEARKRQEAERLEVERKAAEAEAARKAAEEAAAREAEKKAAEEAARKAAEEEAARKAAEEEAARQAAEEEAAIRKAAEAAAARKAAEEAAETQVPDGKTQRLPDDIMELVDQLESRVAKAEEEDPEDLFDVEEELELASAETANSAEEDFQEEDFGLEDLEEEDFEEEDFEEEDFDEEDFDEEDFDEEDFDEEDFEEEDFEEEEPEEAEYEDEDDFDEDGFDEEAFFDEDFDVKDTTEEPLEIEEPSEEEIQKRIKKSKGSGVPFDTGFVVTGRYDLSATSEIGLKAGLTEEQKKLFSYFVPVRGMSEQIVEVLDNDRRAQREGTSKTGNLLVIGRKGSGKTVLAVDIVKAIQKQRNLKQGKVAIVTGESLNKKELANIIQKLKGGAIIIEKAGKLNSRTIKELNHLMERKTGEMLFVLEDQRKPLERILTANPDFKKKFTSRLELPIFINDELVTFGQTYAKENGYKLDEMGILALYSRIDVMQREDHAVSVAEVKEIMDEAIAHSQKANVKHLARRVFGKSTDASDRIILKEEDFKI